MDDLQRSWYEMKFRETFPFQGWDRVPDFLF